MQNLFLKNKLAQKIVLSLLFFASLLFFPNLFYNQNREILALEEEEAEEEEGGGLLCGKEIPNGEAIEKTGELLIALMEELSTIDGKAYEQIRETEEMIEFIRECDTGECKPHCEKRIVYKPEVFDVVYCIPEPCSGQICPQEEIDAKFEEINQTYNLVKESKDKIIELIDGETESLCDKLNEDIRTGAEWRSCPEITKKEVIERKLNKARQEFDKCYISAADWTKVAKGEIAGKLLLNCETVLSQNLPRETKTFKEIEGQKIPICTSLHNWFCCTGP